MTKTTNDYSRLVSLGIFAAGLPVLIGARAAVRRLVRERLSAGSATASRIHLVGYEEDIARFYAGKEVDQLGSRIIGTSYLRRVDPGADAATRHDQLQEDLDLAVSVVRFLRPDDVFVLVPWADTAEVERCIDAFLRVPSALHLRPGAVLDRFPDLQVARVGGVSGINIGRRPLNVGEVMLKRALDLTVATIALVSLSPLLAAIAVAIKLDSPGPVFFRQKRYGFNQQPFGVFKFRSMRADPNAAFRQATRNDSRITRIGAILRRTNLDELPQLINVLRGEMSLVGPRPHALAHDRSFERRIALYARRHNVKPGITGWAQGQRLPRRDADRLGHGAARRLRPALHRQLVDLVRHPDHDADGRLAPRLPERLLTGSRRSSGAPVYTARPAGPRSPGGAPQRACFRSRQAPQSPSTSKMLWLGVNPARSSVRPRLPSTSSDEASSTPPQMRQIRKMTPSPGAWPCAHGMKALRLAIRWTSPCSMRKSRAR
ncbi:exopolysaccharide biosynthesis polyprenyl glycosylphosphotransferase [Methylobacterium radiotolerans]